MRFWGKLGALLALTLLSTALIAACSGDDDDDDGGSESTATATATMTETEEATSTAPPGAGSTVAVTLAEWEVTPDVTTTGPGTVTFNVTNDGAVPHEFVIIRSDEPVDGLPTANSVVDESAVDVVDKTEQLLGGESGELTADLTSGNYILICNIAGHYDLGMRVAFTVE